VCWSVQNSSLHPNFPAERVRLAGAQRWSWEWHTRRRDGGWEGYLAACMQVLPVREVRLQGRGEVEERRGPGGCGRRRWSGGGAAAAATRLRPGLTRLQAVSPKSGVKSEDRAGKPCQSFLYRAQVLRLVHLAFQARESSLT